MSRHRLPGGTGAQNHNEFADEPTGSIMEFRENDASPMDITS
ncbi:hypothetical protein [Allorhizocola rhizosphaerae]|nr:hypothetical protein [Allorhizocola rhizosphaerae]